MYQQFFNKLNIEQKKALFKSKGPSIILAGAGSGKTRVLVAKVVNLIKKEGVNPQSIIMITFTNKAAKEMKTRIEKMLYRKKSKYEKLGFIGTFHSLCAKILRIYGKNIGIPNDYIIYDEADQIKLIKDILKHKNIEFFTPFYVLNRISAAKNEMISPNKFLNIFHDHFAENVADIYKEYEKNLKSNKSLDFDDLLIRSINLFTDHPYILKKYQQFYKYVLVDEFQDTNFIQYYLTKLLAPKDSNITVVGDFSQSIYSWRGADIKNLEKFKNDHPKTKIFYLVKNYRSSQNILDFAYSVIVKNTSHPILDLKSQKKKGDEIVFYETDDEQEEALYTVNEISRLKSEANFKTYAILYRTNAQSRIIEEAFLHYGVPYTLIGGVRFYERREIKDVISYIRLMINPQDRLSKDRIIKIGKRRWEKFQKLYDEYKNKVEKITTDVLINKVFEYTQYLELYKHDDEDYFSRLENIKELKSVALKFPNITEFLEQIALVESEYFESEKKKMSDENTKLMTLHQAKGLEFDCVFITGVEEGLLPHSRSTEDFFELEEERRLFYVGITRAKHRLYILNAKRRFLFGKSNYSIKSRFINEEE
jgi:DNA helicase-2/ATP-dependent DNA helicase PcrA